MSENPKDWDLTQEEQNEAHTYFDNIYYLFDPPQYQATSGDYTFYTKTPKGPWFDRTTNKKVLLKH